MCRPGKYFYPLLFIFILLISSCTKETSEAGNDYNPAIAKTLMNEKYGAGTRQSADVYLPANRNVNTPVVIMLHGGSWTEGDKADLNEVINLMRNQFPQAAFINMNYTYAANTPSTILPAQMNDIEAMIIYLDAKRSLWQVSDKTGLAGVSAGAHLGLLYSYAYDPGKKVKCVVSIVGPTDFSDPFYTGNLLFQAIASNLLGKTWAQDPDLHRSASPALRVTATSPPTFMAYGRLDPLVPVSNAETLKTKLTLNSIVYTYVEYPNEGHEFTQTAINDVAPKVVNFLKSQL